MKIMFYIFFITLAVWVSCATPENTAAQEQMQVKNATFLNWSDPAPGEAELGERGTDLALIVSGWSEGYEPVQIIFRRKESFAAEVVETTGGEVKIIARIIHETRRFDRTSETVSLSDRLVFTDEEGNRGFIEIEEWERVEES